MLDSDRQRARSLKRIRIFLIEDNRIFREGISALIDAQEDLRVVGSIGGGQDVLAKVQAAKPRVVLMDLGLRNGNGLRIASAVKRALPSSRVIVMGLIPSQEEIIEFVEAGAAGFLLKDASIVEVLGTIRSVAHGAKILPPPLTGMLFTHVVDQALKNSPRSLAGAVIMTRREREVIVLVAEGLSNKEIAARLSLSTFTVKSHIHNILEKLALHSRLQIAAHFHQ
jgi:DNA-binding NarL/FixJ family response regulator